MGGRARSKCSSERAAAIAARKLVRDRERLARLAEGGSPERPIVVVSPAEVEVAAAATPCPLCGASLRVLDHEAIVVDGERLRVARTICLSCRAERSTFFALRPIAVH